MGQQFHHGVMDKLTCKYFGTSVNELKIEVWQAQDVVAGCQDGNIAIHNIHRTSQILCYGFIKNLILMVSLEHVECST